METIGLIGVGRIGLPIAENLIKGGYRVVGYRRGPLADFEEIGGVVARSPADVGAQADMVLTCLPNAEALDEVVQGKSGLVHSARPGQIVVELGSHLVPDKERQIAPLAEKGAIFLDGEVGGTPGMVRARKAVVYLAGDAAAAKKAEQVARGFTDICHYFGAFGAASKVKLINNLLVTINLAATGEAMALAAKTGVDLDLLIKAVANGSGGSMQFGIRAPWMAHRQFLPAQGTTFGLSHYFELIGDFADRVGVATPLFNRAIEVHQRVIDEGFGEYDHAVLIDVIGKMKREKSLAAVPPHAKNSK
ncbi:MAG TPA: NAD(P)-dependent oxidoreductase [Pseudolabrys sp.]|nr:NAD(P)-dependent oxidoreductase [Pseudolabrys sp.]